MNIEKFEDLRDNNRIPVRYLSIMRLVHAAVLLCIEEHEERGAEPTPDTIAEELGLDVRAVLDAACHLSVELFGQCGPTHFAVIETSVGPTLWPKRPGVNHHDINMFATHIEDERRSVGKRGRQ